MSVRVHQLAKQCGLTNKEMIEKLQAINYPVKSHSSTVDNITAEALANEYGYVPPTEEPAETPAPAAPAVETPSTPAPSVATPAAPVPAPAPVSQPVPVAPPSPPPSVKPAAPAQTISTPAAPVAPAPAPKPVAPPPPPPPVAPKYTAPPPPPPPVAQPTGPNFTVDEQGNKVITMKPPVVVRDLAGRMGIRPHMLLAELMQLNVFASLNETLTEPQARSVCERMGFLFELERRERGAGISRPPAIKAETQTDVSPEDLCERSPVVTVLGHVDHGKTSLLDAIRKTDVVSGESGGITQHIGASVVTLPDKRTITFLDTPGHEAFTKMRARGANITDIAVLVVAADDGIMPQTQEAIDHAKAAKVPIVVAINKCDLPAANPDRVKSQLQERGLTPEAWGGDVITEDVSATTKLNLDGLLESILVQAEMLELKASPKGHAKGNIIEAQMEAGLGPTATVLVRQGTLKVGDALVCGPYMAKVRALIDHTGKRIKQAPPSTPVKITGLSGLPDAGSEFQVVKNDKEARTITEERQLELRAASASAGTAPRRGARLEDFLSQAASGGKKKLGLVLKTDVQGSLEAISDSLGKLRSDKVELDIIHGAVGNITENDVLLASASKAVIIGFRVKNENGVTAAAKRESVQIKLYTVIYELVEQLEEAMKGLLEPEDKEVVLGRAEVRQIFQLSKGPKVAGCVVSNGRITRTGRVRVLRGGDIQFEGRIGSLRHFQDDVKEVKAGAECGIRVEHFQDLQAGDVLECYNIEQIAATL